MKIVSDKFRYYWKHAKDFCVYKVLHADDPPHRLALGIAVGMFVTLLPLIGFQMILSVSLAWMLRANKLVGIPLVWISNPATAVPIYYPCYRFGCTLLGGQVDKAKWTQWLELQANPAATWGNKITFWWDGLLDIIPPLCLGCLVAATVMGILSYYGSLLAIRSYRLRRWGQLMPPKLTPVDEVGSPPEQLHVSPPSLGADRSSAGEENAA